MTGQRRYRKTCMAKEQEDERENKVAYKRACKTAFVLH